MADVNLNTLVDGLSGKVGKAVMRQRGGRTFLCSSPKTKQEPTEKQKAHRERFGKATRYARLAMLEPEKKAEYVETAKSDVFMTGFTAAVTDYMKAPEIGSIDVDTYKGLAGDTIIVRSAVDYKLFAVKVSLQHADGTIIESGDAVTEGKRLEWVYTATQNVASTSGIKVVVTAIDRPGKEVIAERIL